jgi:hypothetical protein
MAMHLEHPDFELLFDSLLYMARHLLEQSGAFLPIGAAVSAGGEVAHVAAKTNDDYAGAHVILETLEAALRTMAAERTCRAAGLAIDMRIRARKGDVGKDAIWLVLEEKGGKSQGVIVPYAKSKLGGFTFDEPSAKHEKVRIFVRRN